MNRSRPTTDGRKKPDVEAISVSGKTMSVRAKRDPKHKYRDGSPPKTARQIIPFVQEYNLQPLTKKDIRIPENLSSIDMDRVDDMIHSILDAGIALKSDAHAVAELLEQYIRYHRISDMIETDGMLQFTTNRNGEQNFYKHPLLDQMNKHYTEYRRFMEALGMTPRGRVQVIRPIKPQKEEEPTPEVEDEDDGWGEFLDS
jgi:P27 family predicted phage terminase small subunit